MRKKIGVAIGLALLIVLAGVVWAKVSTMPEWKRGGFVSVLLLNHEPIAVRTTEYSPVMKVDGYNENDGCIVLATEGTIAPNLHIALEGTPSYDAFTQGKTANESSLQWFRIEVLADSATADSTAMWNSGGLSSGTNVAIRDTLAFSDPLRVMDAYRLEIIPGHSSPSDATLTAWLFLKKDD